MMKGAGAEARSKGNQATLQYPNPPVRLVDRGRGLVRDRRASAKTLTKLRSVRFGLGVCDAVAVVGTLTALRLAQVGPEAIGADLLLALTIALPVWMTVFRSFGLYRDWQVAPWGEFSRLLGATALGVTILMFATPWWSGLVSRSALILAWLFALILELLARGFFHQEIRRVIKNGGLAMRTVVVGTNAEARRLSGALSANGDSFAPVGYVTEGQNGAVDDGLPALGTLEDLEEIIGRNDIECVFLTSTALARTDVLRVSRACRQAHVELRVWANIPGILSPRLAIQEINDGATLALTPVRLTGVAAALKRSFDLVVASLGLLATLPFLTIAACAIRLTSRGPVLFRQTRVTKDGRPFTMYKFRTMVRDPEQALAGKVVDLTEPFFKLKDDPRLTRVAPMLRRLSLDELPQLFNVLRGDMSIVGPRPLPVEQVEANPELLGPRQEVRSGITGWWQISGRSEMDSEEALRLDLFYIENWSIGLDIYTLLRTFGAVLARKGAW
jgi:exopolysaccharide biosynthesis polyprenyl glycosylphosphotransferase